MFGVPVRSPNTEHLRPPLQHKVGVARLIEAALGIPARRLDSLHEYDNVKAPGSELTLVRDDGYGVAGFAIYAPIADAERVAGSLIDAGAVRADEQTAEVLRIEAGRPAFG